MNLWFSTILEICEAAFQPSAVWLRPKFSLFLSSSLTITHTCMKAFFTLFLPTERQADTEEQNVKDEVSSKKKKTRFKCQSEGWYYKHLCNVLGEEGNEPTQSAVFFIKNWTFYLSDPGRKVTWWELSIHVRDAQQSGCTILRCEKFYRRY